MSFALQCVITIALGWVSFLVVSLLRRATVRHRNAVTARLDEDTVDADAMARYRFTPSRLAKAAARLDSGTFDCLFIGSGPSAMACAAALSQIGYKVRWNPSCTGRVGRREHYSKRRDPHLLGGRKGGHMCARMS